MDSKTDTLSLDTEHIESTARQAVVLEDGGGLQGESKNFHFISGSERISAVVK